MHARAARSAQRAARRARAHYIGACAMLAVGKLYCRRRGQRGSSAAKPRKLFSSCSLSSLLTYETSTVHSQDRYCRAAEGLGTQYHGIRNELCGNFLVDLDIQWFCLGLVALITSPWLTLLLLKVTEGHQKHTGISLPPVVSPVIDVQAQLYHDDDMKTFGGDPSTLMASPLIIANPPAAQALRDVVVPTPFLVEENPVNSPYLQIISEEEVLMEPGADELGWVQNYSMMRSLGSAREGRDSTERVPVETGQGAVRWSDLHGSDWMRNDSMMRGFGGGREEEEIGGTTVGRETVGRSGALPRPLELDLSRSATCCPLSASTSHLAVSQLQQ
jgi:hypothetical protein